MDEENETFLVQLSAAANATFADDEATGGGGGGVVGRQRRRAHPIGGRRERGRGQGVGGGGVHGDPVGGQQQGGHLQVGRRTPPPGPTRGRATTDHYTAVTATDATIAAGATTVKLEVQTAVTQDTLDEADETFLGAAADDEATGTTPPTPPSPTARARGPSATTTADADPVGG